jgi:hypothetical protein
METPLKNIFISVLMWSVAMLLPVLITYYNKVNPAVSAVLLTVLYPILLSFLSRRASFWVTSTVVMLASIVSLITSLVITYVIKAKSPLVITGVPILFFIIALAGISTQMQMYNANMIN